MAAPIVSPDVVLAPSVSTLPLAVQRYAATGTPPSAIRRDLVTVSNQIPRWAYGGFALLAGWMATKAYREWKAKAAHGTA